MLVLLVENGVLITEKRFNLCCSGVGNDAPPPCTLQFGLDRITPQQVTLKELS